MTDLVSAGLTVHAAPAAGQGAGPWWVYVLIIGATLLVLASMIRDRMKRRKK